MEDNSQIRLTSGQVTITESGRDAFIVRSGALLVYVVTYQHGNFGKRVFLYEAKQGEVIPGFCYTDMNYENRRFLFTPRADAVLEIIRGGSTKKLRKGFLSKLEIDSAYADNFNEAITDSTRTAEATNEAFIVRSESMRGEIEQDILQLVQEKKKKRSRRESSSDQKLFLPTCRLIRMSLNSLKPLANIGIFVVMMSATLLLQVLPFGILKLGEFTADEVHRGAVPMPTLWMMLLIMLTAVVGSSLIRSIGELIVGREASRLSDTAQQRVIRQFFSLQFRFFREHESAETANRMLHVKQVVAKVMTGTHSFLFAVIASAACLIMCLWLSPMMTAAGVVLLVLWMTVYVLLMRTSLRYRKKATRYDNRSGSLMYQFITGVIKIRLSGAEEKATLEYLRSFSKKEDAEEVRYQNVHFSHDVFSIAVILFAAIFCLIGGWSASFRLERWAAFLCSFTFTASYTALALRSFLSIGEEYEMIRKLTDDLDRYAEHTADSDKTAPPALDGEIDIRGLRFSYDDSDRAVFDGLDLHIGAGEYVAIVGESGCGKSTLFKLLLGFETPDEGEITYSGQPLSKTDLYLLRKQLGVVLQDGKLISGTIEENIAVTKPDATKQELRKAIRAVGLERDLDTMPMGTQTVLTEDSEMISGGQRQKILIARALLNDPKLLFFDEATGALDNLSQRVITDTLKATDATRVVIAHRLSTVVDCDRIIVLGDGGIAEEGTFDDLMERKGIFYAMAQRQMLVTDQ